MSWPYYVIFFLEAALIGYLAAGYYRLHKKHEELEDTVLLVLRHFHTRYEEDPEAWCTECNEAYPCRTRINLEKALP